jgi:hypothetical protein
MKYLLEPWRVSTASGMKYLLEPCRVSTASGMKYLLEPCRVSKTSLRVNIYLRNMLSYQLVNIYLQISKLTKVITVDLSIHMIEMCFLYKAMSTIYRGIYLG